MTSKIESSSLQGHEYLSREFHYIFRSLFPQKLESTSLKEDYINAVLLLLHKNEERKLHSMKININTIIEKNLDIEAIELALRFHGQVNELSQKTHIIVYLTESHPEFYDIYINERSNFLKGFTILALFTLRSVFKLIKGKILLRLYELV